MNNETESGAPTARPLIFIGPSRGDLREFPEEVQGTIGHALWLAQLGMKSDSAKPLNGFGGAGVLEIFEDNRGDTYRAVYTVRFAEAVYVLHVFQKKSKHGIATPRHEIELIGRRLRAATLKHQQSFK